MTLNDPYQFTPTSFSLMVTPFFDAKYLITVRHADIVSMNY